MAAAGIVLALIAAALSIDLGALASTKREAQKVADLAAIDAAYGIEEATYSEEPHAYVQGLAEDSADRNGFDLAANGVEFVALLGTHEDYAFEPCDEDRAVADDMIRNGECTPDAVQVRVVDLAPRYFAFFADPSSVEAVGVAHATARAGVGTGSRIGTASVQADVLNALLNEAFGLTGVNGAPASTSTSDEPVFSFSTLEEPVLVAGASDPGPQIGLDLVSYQGLADANMAFESLMVELGAASPHELAAGTFAVVDLLDAMVAVLEQDGPVSELAVEGLVHIRQRVSGSLALTMDFLRIEQGGEEAALRSDLNALNLVVATGMSVIDGDAFVDVPLVGVTVPGLTVTNASVRVIEAPQYAYGPVATYADNAQVQVRIETGLTRSVSLLGLNAARLDGQLPVSLIAGQARGTITEIDCVEQSVFIGVDSAPAEVQVGADLVLSAVPLLVRVNVFALEATGTGTVSGMGGSTDFLFPDEKGEWRSVPAESVPLALDNPLAWNVHKAQVLGLGLGVASTTQAVLNEVDLIADELLAAVGPALDPVLQALGVTVGGADVTANALACTSPELVG